jgi:hypothetical protein
MRTLLTYVAVGWTLAACSSSSKTSMNFYVDPPPDMDFACIGVAGFDVVVASGSRNSPSGPEPNSAPVLDPGACRLTRPFSISDVDVDAPVSVVVTGRDGAGVARVEATAHIDNLHAGPTHLQLKATAAPPLPVLVVYRMPLLGGAKMSDVTRLVVIAMRRSMTLLDIAPGDYFGVEPGAYGIPANLAPDGTDDGMIVFVDVTTGQGVLPRARLTLAWMGRYYEAR